MPTVVFIKPDGSAHTISVDEGTTLMEAGRDNNMGIEGTCEATCPVRPVMLFSNREDLQGWRPLR